MNIKTVATHNDNDAKRRAFSPIQMDLVERLALEADTRTATIPLMQQDARGVQNRLAA
ncbi:hypothetical protein [Yoonia sp. 2307UL14-13]|uniref:hypothetical protein n=1 Tax=Yoonia sp. 2307UL14-13 TaxID=3126506 RepID=UPI0030A1800A